MEKILVAIDTCGFDANVVQFACHLARLTGSKLTGIFLEDRAAERMPVFEAIAKPDVQASQAVLEVMFEQQSVTALREKNILRFKDLTLREGVRSNIYLHKGVPVDDLVNESLFADVVVVDGAAFAELSDEPPTDFVRRVLHEAGCPVIVAPENFHRVDDIVFCYDGGRSSLYAMKQFAYLFPQLCMRRAKVIDLRKEGATPIEQARVIAWLRTHFTDVEWLGGGPEATDAFFTFLVEKAGDFVVMGSYGKGLLTSFFSEDAEHGMRRTTQLPIFIAHC